MPQPVAQALAAAGIPDSAIGVYVREIGQERPAVSFGAERPLNPASTMKLVTTYAGLDALGPAYQWTTEAHTAGTLRGDVLEGDLVLKGGGDPKLTIENFWLLLRNLRARGIKDIRGDLVLDRSLFAVEEVNPASFDDQPTRPYNTGPDALLVNFKAVTLQFLPEPDGRTLRIAAEPSLPQVQIVNNVTLGDMPCGDWLARMKFDAAGNGDQARLTFTGVYPRDCGERSRSFSVLNHRGYVAALFQQLWRDLGGTLAGTVRDGTLPPGARLLATAKSPALSEVIRDINKFSNNVMARQLFLTLGAAGNGGPATHEKAREFMRRWIATKEFAAPELVMENGSGLSRVERISAQSLGQLLVSAYRSAVMPEFISSLPLVAVDGTMRKRLANASVAGQAHIKTGSLAGVRSIAGYVLDTQGKRQAVVFIVNHANAAGAQPAADALLRWVHTRR